MLEYINQSNNNMYLNTFLKKKEKYVLFLILDSTSIVEELSKIRHAITNFHSEKNSQKNMTFLMKLNITLQ